MPPSDEPRPEERSGAALSSPPPPSDTQSAPAPAPAPSPAASPAPGRPPARRAAGRADQQRATAALFLALLSLAGLLAFSNVSRGVYVVVFALAAGVLAAWFAGTAIGRARHQRTALPHGSVTALVIAGIGMAISLVLLAGFAVFGKQLSAYSQCLRGANTVSAQQACHSQFMHSVTGRLSGLRSGSRG